MTVGVAERLDTPAATVEILPGDGRDGNGDLVTGVLAIRTAFEERFGTAPAALLEDRTHGQLIVDGKSIARSLEHPDVQPLHTIREGTFLADLAAIPRDALEAFRVHRLHRAIPTPAEPIPWREVFELIQSPDRPVLITPGSITGSL